MSDDRFDATLKEMREVAEWQREKRESERARQLRNVPHVFAPSPDDKRLRDGIVSLIKQFEALAGQEDADAAECAGVNQPGEDAYRMLAQGRRDVCFALRTLIGVSKISDL